MHLTARGRYTDFGLVSRGSNVSMGQTLTLRRISIKSALPRGADVDQFKPEVSAQGQADV